MNAVDPLYERDPEAWQRYLAEGNATQPRKRVGADALLFDERGRILLVDPNYKPNWDLPGGMADANEPPDTALRRELREELGLHLPDTALSLLCLDWVSPHGPWDDSLMFIFDAGELTDRQVAALQIADDELDSFEFVAPEQARARLRPYVWDRVRAALHARETGRSSLYLRDGHPVS
ncbi:NUDIX hydrolase [Nocardia sp. NBC_01499]|uniref:NUDIX domain-containing protein n=1 Tax=Nocardia sp. NBC_01499 TaxID=2903597 RepID=UPI00386C809E